LFLLIAHLQVIDSAMQDGLLYMSTFVWEASAGNFWNKERGHNIIDGGTLLYSIFALYWSVI
jgi:hypothetical protein